ncbi:hypothetical protein CBM2589_B30290 [Cupriavidus taiwanensis]|uniref:Uncharacterized protein n=1 Tax=Cupriavidus taiwanensis TaxID=164546 RepID=A0A375BV54_9BURK|nr:hypothetical protein CBM2589_B30290 [Cupriavidus taiwanensis]
MPRARRNLSERSKFRHPQSSATLGKAASRAALSARHATRNPFQTEETNGKRAKRCGARRGRAERTDDP